MSYVFFSNESHSFSPDDWFYFTIFRAEKSLIVFSLKKIVRSDAMIQCAAAYVDARRKAVSCCGKISRELASFDGFLPRGG